jgi:hypothetical protein
MADRSAEMAFSSMLADSPAKRVIDQLRNNFRLVPLGDEKILPALQKAVVAGSLTALHELHQLVWDHVAGQNFVTGNHSDATLAVLDAEMTRARHQLPTAGYLSPSMREYLLSAAVAGMGDYAAIRHADRQLTGKNPIASGTFLFPGPETAAPKPPRERPAGEPAAEDAPAGDAQSVRALFGISVVVGLLALALLITYFAYSGSAGASLVVRVNYDVGVIIGGTLAGAGVLIAALAYARRRGLAGGGEPPKDAA